MPVFVGGLKYQTDRVIYNGLKTKDHTPSTGFLQPELPLLYTLTARLWKSAFQRLGNLQMHHNGNCKCTISVVFVHRNGIYGLFWSAWSLTS